MSAIIFWVFAAAALLGMPLAFSIGLSSVAALAVSDVDFSMPMNWFPVGGRIARMAWGSRMRRN